MIQQAEILKTISCDFLDAKLRSDGIVHIHIKANTLIDLEKQAEMEEIYWKIAEIHRPFIFTGEEFVSVTADARKNSIEMEDRVPQTSVVLCTRNLAQKILADYYYKFNKPKKPLFVTRDFEKGIQWIHDNFELKA